uniref:ribosomal protein S7 n=1 Tax=Cryptomonas pyrenoidifera TaxID=233184 RepID=UPI00226D174F|nr:ribosomal protein S7 [Cryptomonas pyrenoidifera]UZP15131.1 ribosomal protein S7 [Cryptomonas pyrenoidifera]
MEQKNSNNNYFKYIITSFIKVLQKTYSKESSEIILKNSFSYLKKSTKKEPLYIFKDAFNKSKPFCEVKSIRISGTNYKVPVEVDSYRQKTLVFKWIISNSIKRSDFCLSINLAKEILDTCDLNSKTIKMCDDFHKIAESNKVYIQSRN